MIISFNHYNISAYNSFTKKDAPLKFVYGFSLFLVTTYIRISRKADMVLKNNSKELNKILRSVSLGVMAFTMIIFLGLLYTLKPIASDKASSLNNDSSGSIETDKQLTSNSQTNISEEMPQDESYNIIKDAIELFEENREGIEKAFLGNNESPLSISEPLNLISEYGDEKILIEWSFETPDIIDVFGNILYENIENTGCSTLAYAKLTLNDVTATLTIPIAISPP